MASTNASFSPMSRTYRLEQQIQKLEAFMEDGAVCERLRAFDFETEKLLLNLNCQDGKWLETYKYATLGEAGAIVNLPESAQQRGARDRLKYRFNNGDKSSWVASATSLERKPWRTRCSEGKIVKIRLSELREGCNKNFDEWL